MLEKHFPCLVNIFVAKLAVTYRSVESFVMTRSGVPTSHLPKLVKAFELPIGYTVCRCDYIRAKHPIPNFDWVEVV